MTDVIYCSKQGLIKDLKPETGCWYKINFSASDCGGRLPPTDESYEGVPKTVNICGGWGSINVFGVRNGNATATPPVSPGITVCINPPCSNATEGDYNVGVLYFKVR